jgi:signal transduction histidine kinase
MDAVMMTREGAVPLETVLATDELRGRPSRPPNHERENAALGELCRVLATTPETVLQRLAEVALSLCKAGSAGISLLSKTDNGKSFVWPAVAGAWVEHIGGGTPRDFGPCGVVLDRDAVQLFNRPERYFPYLQPVTPPIEEGLLTPFYVDGKAVGTVWVISHDPDRKFDREDLRIMLSLGVFASSAYQVLESRLVLERDREELLKADRRKTEFLALLAHELRNPLAPIKNAVQLLSIPNVDAAVASSATGILGRQVNQMVRLVNDLLDISRISNGKIELQMRPANIGRVVAHAVETIRPHFDEKEQTLTVEVAHSIRANADTERLAQVFGNLLHNASKFSKRGGHVHIAALEEQDAVVIRVSDHGVGVAAEDLSKIFDMFSQVSTSFDRAHGGLGIGLALVKSLIESHGGTVVADSPGLGHGTTVTVRLPSWHDDPSQHTVSEAGPVPARKSYRIMIVEDNRDSAHSLAELLKIRGHATFIAHNGADAINAAAREPFDVVVLDIGLPGLDGYEVARQLRAGSARNALLIALTGWGQKEDRDSSSAAGFDAHLVKPLDVAHFDELLAGIS